MAHMIPDKLPYGVSAGEKKTFTLLQNLPDDCIVYYEPIISSRYPHFIVILPSVGVLLIEVIGWRSSEIEKISDDGAIVAGEISKLPRSKAKDYLYKLLDVCRKTGNCEHLIHETGENKGRFKIPFAHLVILPYIDSEQFKQTPIGDLTPFISPQNTIMKDQLADLLDQEPSEKQLVDLVRGYFDQKWPVSLTGDSLTELRSLIHPEITIEPPAYATYESPQTETPANEGTLGFASAAPKIKTLKILDLEQEKEARKIGSGHRLLWGVAGSGKTIILIARAKILAQENPQKRILVTCYNITLAHYLKNAFKDFPSIEATHFHDIAHHVWKTTPKKGETTEQFSERLTENVKKLNVPPVYDMILVDEAQDFDPVWFSSLLTLIKDPEDGDFVIVGDGKQGIYKSRKITWKSLGIQAKGRTTYFKKNYRNSKEIIMLAAKFSASGSVVTDEEATVEGVSLNPECAVRSSDIKPVLIHGSQAEIGKQVVKMIEELLDGSFNGRKLDMPLRPSEIAVMYPAKTLVYGSMKAILSELRKKNIPVLHIQGPQEKRLICSPDLKMLTIYSAKGLQYKAVFLLGVDSLPRNSEVFSAEADEKLMYVAMTRAEDYLVVAAGDKHSSFVERIEEALHEGVIEDYHEGDEK